MKIEEFIPEFGMRKFGVVEYIRRLEKDGKDELSVQVELLRNQVLKNPRLVDEYYTFYKSVKNQIAWK